MWCAVRLFSSSPPRVSYGGAMRQYSRVLFVRRAGGVPPVHGGRYVEYSVLHSTFASHAGTHSAKAAPERGELSVQAIRVSVRVRALLPCASVTLKHVPSPPPSCHNGQERDRSEGANMVRHPITHSTDTRRTSGTSTRTSAATFAARLPK